MPASVDDVTRAFNDRLKALACPHCKAIYTDYAVNWCDGWLEGGRDAMRELGVPERDGPIKLKCEACGGLAVTNAFFSPPKPA